MIIYEGFEKRIVITNQKPKTKRPLPNSNRPKKENEYEGGKKDSNFDEKKSNGLD